MVLLALSRMCFALSEPQARCGFASSRLSKLLYALRGSRCSRFRGSARHQGCAGKWISQLALPHASPTRFMDWGVVIRAFAPFGNEVGFLRQAPAKEFMQRTYQAA